MAAASRKANGATMPSTCCVTGRCSSIFRRAAEAPLYRIEKTPRLARRQGAFSVIATTGLILKRGHELCRVLRVFDRSRLELVKA